MEALQNIMNLVNSELQYLNQITGELSEIEIGRENALEEIKKIMYEDDAMQGQSHNFTHQNMGVHDQDGSNPNSNGFWVGWQKLLDNKKDAIQLSTELKIKRMEIFEKMYEKDGFSMATENMKYYDEYFGFDLHKSIPGKLKEDK